MAKLKKRLIQLQSKENDDRLNSLLHINIKAITKLHASKIKHYFRASYLSRKVRFCAQADAPATTTSLARVAKDIFALEESSTLGNHSKTSVPKTRKIFTSKEPLIILQEKMQYFISNPQAYTQIVPVSGTYPRIALDELPALVKTHQPAFTLYLECLEHLSQQTHWTLPLGNNSLYKKLNQATQKLISEFSKPPLNKEDPYYLFFNILLAALLEETKQLLTSKLSKKNMRCVACFSLS